jgi:hypothetical protein
MISPFDNKSRKSTKKFSISFVLYSITIYWVGLLSGVFVSHRGLDLTATSATLQLLPSPDAFYQSSRSSNSNSNSNSNIKPHRLLKPEELKLATPIIVMGLMKAGTTSIFGYFKCGLDPKHSKLSHYNCNDPAKKRGTMSCGKRMRRNVTKMKNTTAFHTMDMFHLYSELDGQEYNGGISVPQWHFIQAVHDNFPNATWILNLRDPHDWLKSINRWQDLRQRFIDNPFKPDLPIGVGGDDNDMIKFYNAQAQKIRDFAAEHPSHNLVEVQIDSPEAGEVMEDAFGISADACWKKRNGNHDGKAIWSVS